MRGQDGNLVAGFNAHNRSDLQQYVRVVETAYVARGSGSSRRHQLPYLGVQQANLTV